jgi:hypothetical protein
LQQWKSRQHYIETKTKSVLKGKPMNQNQHWLIKLCSKPLKDQPAMD